MMTIISESQLRERLLQEALALDVDGVLTDGLNSELVKS